MVRVNGQETPSNYLMGETADVLLSINSALDFTKIISTLYTGLPINFFETHYGFRDGTTTVSERQVTEESKSHRKYKNTRRAFTRGFLNKN